MKDIQYGNLTMTVFEYDAANRLTKIDHRDPLDAPILTYTYSYLDNNLISDIAESRAGATPIDTDILHDDRGRLIQEVGGEPSFFITYDYDEGGNRTSKTDFPNDRRVDYVYDTDDPEGYGSANNRLMYYETWDTSGTPDVKLSETYYYYNCSGNVTNVVTKTMNPGTGPEFTNTRLSYAMNQQAVTFVLGEQWNGDVNPTGYQLNFAREFRYDSSRARYLNRELDTADLLQTPDPWYTST